LRSLSRISANVVAALRRAAFEKPSLNNILNFNSDKMKKLLTTASLLQNCLLAAVFLLSLHSNAQYSSDYTTAKRPYKDSTGKYIVQYDYNWRFASVPAVEGAEPHYDATITMFKVVGKKLIKIGSSFRGVYVANGCFEDDPSTYVEKANRQKKSEVEAMGENGS
jgi:hypothetical protein